MAGAAARGVAASVDLTAAEAASAPGAPLLSCSAPAAALYS